MIVLIFFVNHLLSSIPNYNFENEDFIVTQNTASQRIEWWTFVIEKQFSQLKSIIFGLGFGMPLIDFIGYQNISIREPHNSYITIFARTGVFGFLLYFLLMIKIFKVIYNLFLLLKKNKMENEIKYFYFIGIYILFIYSMGLADSVLSYSFYSIPLNIFIGIMISTYFKLAKNENK